MNKLIIPLMLTLTSFTTFARTGNFGVGVLLGDPTALSGKYFFGADAVDMGLSFGHDELLIFGDYLKHFPGKLGKENAFVAALTPYVGVGPIFAFGDHNNHRHRHFIDDEDDDFAFGGRIPFGVEWMSKDIPVGVSLEVVPGLVVIPETDGFIQGGVAVRYYF